MWAKDVQRPYGGYPGGLQAFGWTLLAVLLVITPLTMRSSEAGSLPTLPASGGVTEVARNPVTL